MMSAYQRIVRVHGDESGCGLRGQLIQLAGGDSTVHTDRDFLCHQHLHEEPAGKGAGSSQGIVVPASASRAVS